MNRIVKFNDVVRHFQRISANQVTYVEHVDHIDNYMVTLKNFTCPPPNSFNNPSSLKYYDDIEDCYGQKSSFCFAYTKELRILLTNAPNECIETVDTIDKLLGKASEEVEDILKAIDCGFEPISDALEYCLDRIVTISNIQIAALNSLISNLEKFETTYTDGLYNSMSTVIEKLDLESENFQEYINTLKEYIKKIKEAIEQQKKEFIKDGLLIGGGVIIGAVIIGTTILSGGTALPITLASILGIATIGATCIPLGLDIKELKDLEERLKYYSERLTSYESDMSSFADWQIAVEDVRAEIAGVKEDFKNLKEAWSGVNEGFSSILDLINDTNVEISAEEWEDIKKTINNLYGVTQTIRENSNQYLISDKTVSNAVFTIGMSNEDVQKTINSAPQTSFYDYMMAI